MHFVLHQWKYLNINFWKIWKVLIPFILKVVHTFPSHRLILILSSDPAKDLVRITLYTR